MTYAPHETRHAQEDVATFARIQDAIDACERAVSALNDGMAEDDLKGCLSDMRCLLAAYLSDAQEAATGDYFLTAEDMRGFNWNGDAR